MDLSLTTSSTFLPSYADQLGGSQIIVIGPCYSNASNISCTFYDPGQLSIPTAIRGTVQSKDFAFCTIPTIFGIGQITAILSVTKNDRTIEYPGELNIGTYTTFKFHCALSQRAPWWTSRAD